MSNQFTRREAGVRTAAAGALALAPLKSAQGAISEPFQIAADPGPIEDLRRRLRATRFPDAVVSDWSMGTDLGFLRQLVAAWADTYPAADRIGLLNRMPHRRIVIGGYGVHLLHYRSGAPDAVPLLLMNGWPSSFVEYGKIVPILGAGPVPFDVVIPALPGFGFSDAPKQPYAVEPHDLYPRLMSALGYDRFFASGTDIGAGVATRIALRHPQRVMGIHVSAVAEKPRPAGAPPPTLDEQAYDAKDAAWEAEEGGYQAIQSSRPQTLAYGLTDSPAGMAAWIVEKFRAWSDCGGDVFSVFPLEMLLDNLSIYWISGTMASSLRYYFEAQHLRPPLQPDDFVAVPTAVAVWPHDLAQPPIELARRLYNVTRYTRFPRGGHFPAWEAPERYAADLKAFVADTLATLA